MRDGEDHALRALPASLERGLEDRLSHRQFFARQVHFVEGLVDEVVDAPGVVAAASVKEDAFLAVQLLNPDGFELERAQIVLGSRRELKAWLQQQLEIVGWLGDPMRFGVDPQNAAREYCGDFVAYVLRAFGVEIRAAFIDAGVTPDALRNSGGAW